MNEIQIFNSPQFGEIRVTVGVDNEPLFCLADVCKALELSNPTMVKARLKEDGLSTAEVIDSIGRRQSATFINESNLYKCIFQSRTERAEQFQDWVFEEVLPSIRKTGQYISQEARFQSLQNPQLSYAQTQLFLTDAFIDRLRLNDASRLEMYQQLGEQYGLKLPNYVPSKGVVKSAKALLKDIGSDLSAIKFNLLLEKKGFVTQMTRPSTNGKEKKFWNITEQGHEYGENQVNPKNPKETQPGWYIDKFRELYDIVIQDSD